MLQRTFCLLGLAALPLSAPLDPGQSRPDGSQDSSQDSRRAPNIVLIVADDLGWGELGCYGQERIATPRIDALSAQGLRFTQFYSGSAVCAPSRCVLLTGRHTGNAIVRNNRESGGWGPDEPEGQYPLPAGTPSLARTLQQAGYATAAIGKWGLGGPGSTGAPNDQGFDLFFGYLCQRVAHNYYPTHLWRNADKLPLEGHEYFAAHQQLSEALLDEAEYEARYAARHYAPDLMLDEALAFVRASAERPFFLYYASPIPHVALQVPAAELEAYPAEWDTEPYLGQRGYLPHPSPRRAYAAMISHLDADVGRLVDLVDELGLSEDTLFLVTSDNGPTYNGGTDAEFFASAAGLRGLKGSLYEGGLRVPLVARWPGRVPAGSTSAHVAGFQDLLPTLVELGSATHAAPTDGQSFAQHLFGHAAPEPSVLYWELGQRQALRAGRWKALRTRLGQQDLTVEVYDLERDPAETSDLASADPERTRLLASWLDRLHTSSETFPIPALDERSETR